MKTLLIALLAFTAITAQAETTTSTAQQTATSGAVAQGTIQFSQSPADQHLSETVRNVSGPILGAYAASFSQMNCAQTAQLGAAVAGFSIAGGASRDSHTCVLEVAAAESSRQSTITDDTTTKLALQKAAIRIRCQVSDEVRAAYEASGLDCSLVKPGATAEADVPRYYTVAQTK